MPVPDAPVVVAAAPAAKPEIDFGIPDVPVEVTPGGGDDRPRDEHGRFVKAAEVAETPKTEEAVVVEEVETPEVETPVVATVPGLDVEDAVPPTFGLDGKFVGGKFLGKYETLDDALQGHKHALKRIGQLERELSEAQAGAPDVGPPYVDVDSMTPDQIAERVATEIGAKEEMSYEDRVAYEENPAAYIAKMLVKGRAAMEKVTAEAARYNQSWEANTKAAYPKLYDKAHPLGKTVWNDLRQGRVKLPELQVLLGMGIMVRENMLSGEETVTRVKPVGRAPETRASVPVRQPERTPGPREEQRRELQEMQDAAYG